MSRFRELECKGLLMDLLFLETFFEILQRSHSVPS